jgi:hypothetical protein
VPDLRVMSPRVGDVHVSEELVESLGADTIDAAISRRGYGQSALHHAMLDAWHSSLRGLTIGCSPTLTPS